MTMVKWKALACLIRTFLELAAHPRYNHSQFLSTLYRVHVLGEDLQCPATPPYYNSAFFNIIKDARESGLNVSTMTNRQWYYHLLRDTTSGPSRAESAHPDTDWPAVWRKVRLPCLGSEESSHVFRLLHDLLPSEGRLSQVLPGTPPTCKHGCPGSPVADTTDCFLMCRLTSEVGQWLLRLVSIFDTRTTSDKLL